MGRAQRVDIEGGIHHVMNRGVNRGAVFFADADRVEFGRRLADIHVRFGVETLAYCLMSNHYHLLLRLPDAGLSSALHHLGSVYTRHTNDRVGRDGPLFRGRFHAIPVLSDPYLSWSARYIHRNALDVPGVARADQYRWSSYRTYLGHRRPPPWMNLDLVLDCFDGSSDRLAAFTDDDRHEVVDARATITLADLRCLVAFAIAEDDIGHGGDDAPQWLGRTVELLLTDDRLDPTVRSAILADRAFPSDAAHRMALSRARRRLATEPALGRVLDAVRAHLGAHARPM